MNFCEATEIAKRNPGSVLTRDANGQYVVIGANGVRLLSASTVVPPEEISKTALDVNPEALINQLRLGKIAAENKAQEYEQQASLLRSLLHSSQIQLNESQASLASAQQKLANAQAERNSLEVELRQLKNDLHRVTDDDWTVICKREQENRERLAAAKRAERRGVNCACKGEVENCARCGGRGTYFTDGYGHIV